MLVVHWACLEEDFKEHGRRGLRENSLKGKTKLLRYILDNDGDVATIETTKEAISTNQEIQQNDGTDTRGHIHRGDLQLYGQQWVTKVFLLRKGIK